MRITIIAVGRLKEKYWREAAEEYLKRLRPYADVRVAEVADRDVTRDEDRALAEEGAGVLRVTPKNAWVVALDSNGRSLSSEAFAEELGAHMLQGRSHVAFVIGGAAGLAPELVASSDTRLSLGAITLPHQLARVVLLEQIYRAFRILRGEPYHR